MIQSTNKQKGGWRKLLQERFDDKNSKRRELTDEEQTRLTKLEGILDTLRRGEKVQNRQLQLWLTEDEYKKI